MAIPIPPARRNSTIAPSATTGACRRPGWSIPATNSDGPLADLSDARNVLFGRCRFLATTGALPWSVGAIYADCAMEQRSNRPSFPRGRFVGRNTITGRVDLYSSTIAGDLTVNGRPVPRGRIG